ncbi:MAG: AI-2E family transporter [Phycisphaeraceae bacterium]|nr:AI-2E family transporter [Phycisphaeraceae bacterium]
MEAMNKRDMADFRGGRAHLWDLPWFRDVLTLAAVAVTLLAAWQVWAILAPVLIGLAMAYLFDPLLSVLERRCRVPRLVSAIVLLLLVLAVVGIGLALLMPVLIEQARDLGRNMQEYANWLSSKVGMDWQGVMDWLQNHLLAVASGSPDTNSGQSSAIVSTTQPAATQAATQPTAGQAAGLFGRWAGMAAQGLGRGLGVLGAVIGVGSYLVLAVVITVFCFVVFAWRLSRMVAWTLVTIPGVSHPRTLHVLGRMDKAVSGFIRGRMIQSLVMGAILSVGWMLVGVPYWLLLGVLGGLMNMIPYAASLVWLVAVGATVLDGATSSEGLHWMHLVLPTLIYFGAQLLDGWVVEPIVQGKATNLDPLTVLLAVLIGGSLLGVVGMVLAIPVAACLKILAEEVWVPGLRRRAAVNAGSTPDTPGDGSSAPPRQPS